MDHITTHHLIEAIGWLASILTVATYAMNTMIPLRILAMVSSVCFIVYTAILQLWPLLAMELILLPINAYRFWQILSLRRRLTKVTEAMEPDFSVMKAYGKKSVIDAQSVIFAEGDPVDSLYFLAVGQVEVEGVGVRLSQGEIFGEMAFFTENATRTATVRCLEDSVVYELDKTRFMRLQFEDPSFGMAVMRTITRRLVAKEPRTAPA